MSQKQFLDLRCSQEPPSRSTQDPKETSSQRTIIEIEIEIIEETIEEDTTITITKEIIIIIKTSINIERIIIKESKVQEQMRTQRSLRKLPRECLYRWLQLKQKVLINNQSFC